MRAAYLFVAAATATACGLTLGLDGYRQCQNDECDASFDANSADSDAANDSGAISCTTSDDCVSAPNAARVCSTGYCRSILKLGQGSSTFSCVVLSDGTVRCWGDNNVGQLGGGDYDDHALPVTVIDSNGDVLKDVAEVGMEWDTGCARTNAGKVYCWGSNEGGHLGVGLQAGATNSKAQLLSLGDRIATQLTVGQTDACVLMQDQSLFCWGNADQGQLGDPDPGDGGTVAAHDTPVQVPVPKDVKVVAVGERQMCFQTTSAPGSLTCWGNGWLGVLDNGHPLETDLSSYPPAYPFEKNTFVVAGGLAIDSFHFGEEDICALVSGTVYCWGGDYFHMATGQGGNGAPAASRILKPYQVSIPPASEVDPSWRASCAVAQDQAYCWGYTSNGAIGIGPWGLPLVGVKKVLNLSDVGKVLAVSMHVLSACALVDDGHVYCWGQAGALGSKLGDGTSKKDRDAPDTTLPVMFPP